jgi:2-methylcitrate dehydratase PrpD
LFKFHASCYLTHAAIECAHAARQTAHLVPANIARVVVKANRQNDKVCNIAVPRSGLEVKFSLRQTVAMALAGMDTASTLAFSDQVANDAMLAALREKVHVELVDDLSITGADLVVTTVDGSVLRKSHDAGTPASDLTTQREKLRRKFDALVTPLYGADTTHQLASLVFNIDRQTNIGALMRAAALPE